MAVNPIIILFSPSSDLSPEYVFPHHNQMNVALVTDSTCDIPTELARYYNITIVPNVIIIEGESIDDDEDFSRQDFYDRLPDMKTFPTTSTASSGRYQAVYENLLKQGYDSILSIHASRFLSGIYNAASAAAQAFAGRVQVIDSQQISLGLGFQVLEAAEALSMSATRETVLTFLEHMRQKIHLVALLDTLEYLRRSGRVSWARASLGTLLNLKPFVGMKDGLVHRLGEVRTRRKGILRLREILQSLGPLKRLAILHTNSFEDAHQILESTPSVLTDPLVVNVTTVIGAHVGPRSLGFVAVAADTNIT